MQVIISGKHLKVTPPIQTYIQEKVGRLPRLYDRIQKVEAIIDKADNHNHEEIELIVNIAYGETIVVTKTGPDLYACIDEAASTVERQLRDHKEKVRSHKR